MDANPRTPGFLNDQLLIVLAKRLSKLRKGPIVLPISEVDDTGMDILYLECNQQDRTFTLTLGKKS